MGSCRSVNYLLRFVGRIRPLADANWGRDPRATPGSHAGLTPSPCLPRLLAEPTPWRSKWLGDGNRDECGHAGVGCYFGRSLRLLCSDYRPHTNSVYGDCECCV